MGADTYWAAEPDQRKFTHRAGQRFRRHIDKARSTAQFSRTRRLMSAYYGFGLSGNDDASDLRATGEEGELIAATHNLVRPGLNNVLGLIAGQRPAMKPIATNTDATSLEQALLADSLREYWERTLDLSGREIDAVRGGLLGGSHSLIQSWDRFLGEATNVNIETGEETHEGDVEVLSVPWWRCAYDPLAISVKGRRWCIFRKMANRFDLAAQYPHVAERLLSVGRNGGRDDEWIQQVIGGDGIVSFDQMFEDRVDTEDGVWVWEVRHIPTSALPNGRLCRFVDSETILWDSAAPRDGGEPVAYPYLELHAYEYAPERVVGSTRGHAPTWDVGGLQRLADIATTAIATTANIASTPHLWTPDPAGMNATVMSTGPVVLSGAVKPEVLQFQALNESVAGVLNVARELARESFALNKTVMGEPDKGMPASAQALQRAQAVQYHQTAQGEYVSLVEQNVTGVLRLAQRFAQSQRVAEIAGQSGAHEVRKWSEKDVAGVRRFACEPINPMLRSYEARMALAENLSNKVDPKTGEPWMTKDGYLSVYQTGDVKEPLESSRTRMELVSEHKAMLRKGIGLPPVDIDKSMQVGAPVFVDDNQPHVRLMRTDPHWLAYNEYRAVLDSPSARENPAVVKAVTDVLTETIRLWGSLTPDELAALGGPALPSQLAMAAMAQPQTGGAPPPGEADTTVVPPEEKTKLPKPPPNPITNEQQGRESLGGLENA